MLRHPDGLHAPPDSAAPVNASALLALVSESQFNWGTRTSVQLGAAKTAAELSPAANFAWTACSADQRPCLRVQLSEFIRDVMTSFGPAVDSSAVNETLARLALVVAEAAQRGYSTSTTAAATIKRCDSLPAAVPSPLSKAVSLETFRFALRDALNLAHHSCSA